jgi:peptide/nickel transport system substrate-binding protein
MTRRAVIAAAALAAVSIAVPSGAVGQELRVGVQTLAPYIDPGRDHSNVGS